MTAPAANEVPDWGGLTQLSALVLSDQINGGEVWSLILLLGIKPLGTLGTLYWSTIYLSLLHPNRSVCELSLSLVCKWLSLPCVWPCLL